MVGRCGDFIQKKLLNAFIYNFVSDFLHLKYNTVNNIVYYELGRKNMQCVRYVRIVKYWLKIMKSKDTRFTKIV